MRFDEDHVHFVMIVTCKYAIAKMMEDLQNRSALLLIDKFDFLKKCMGGANLLVSSYFVNSVGIDKSIVANYIK